MIFFWKIRCRVLWKRNNLTFAVNFCNLKFVEFYIKTQNLIVSNETRNITPYILASFTHISQKACYSQISIFCRCCDLLMALLIMLFLGSKSHSSFVQRYISCALLWSAVTSHTFWLAGLLETWINLSYLHDQCIKCVPHSKISAFSFSWGSRPTQPFSKLGCCFW